MALITTFRNTSYVTLVNQATKKQKYMLTISRKKALLPIKEYYFWENPVSQPQSDFFSIFIQSKKPLQGFIPFTTHLIDLFDKSDALYRSISKNTRYKIKRAERNCIEPTYDPLPTQKTITVFKDFYDRFARTKQVSACNNSKMSALAKRNALLLSYAKDRNGALLVGHAYIVDHYLGRIRLLYSASHFRNGFSPTERNAIGMANRFLHWQDILYCKDAGYKTYDLGGVALASSDLQKMAIARFKTEFGGVPTTEFNGYSSSNFFLRCLLPRLVRRFR